MLSRKNCVIISVKEFCINLHVQKNTPEVEERSQRHIPAHEEWTRSQDNDGRPQLNTKETAHPYTRNNTKSKHNRNIHDIARWMQTNKQATTYSVAWQRHTQHIWPVLTSKAFIRCEWNVHYIPVRTAVGSDLDWKGIAWNKFQSRLITSALWFCKANWNKRCENVFDQSSMHIESWLSCHLLASASLCIGKM